MPLLPHEGDVGPDLPLFPSDGDVGPDFPLFPVGEVGPDFPLFPVSKRSSFMPMIIYTRIQRIPMMMKHFGRRYNMVSEFGDKLDHYLDLLKII